MVRGLSTPADIAIIGGSAIIILTAVMIGVRVYRVFKPVPMIYTKPFDREELRARIHAIQS